MFPKTKQDFLNSFTENTILTLVIALREEEIERKENERIRRTVEEEKMKIKFSTYPNNIRAPEKIQTIPLQPIEIKKEQVLTKEEYKPSITQTMQQTTQQTVITTKPQNIQNITQIQNQEKKPFSQKREVIANIKLPQNQPSLQQNEIDFGKILFLIRDPLITYIECPAENQNVIIKKAGHTLKTQIILTKEEMIAIITAFSYKTRIPLIEGLLNAKYENLEMSAIVSNIISPSFIIKKEFIPGINQNRGFSPRPPY